MIGDVLRHEEELLYIMGRERERKTVKESEDNQEYLISKVW